MGKYYLSCPDCRTRLRRTGKKEEELTTASGDWLYMRELYSESRAFFTKGQFSG